MQYLWWAGWVSLPDAPDNDGIMVADNIIIGVELA